MYSCFDFQLSSDVPLTELSPAPIGDPRPVVNARLAPVPNTLPGAGVRLHGVEVAADSAMLSVQGVGRFLVREGREILIDPVPEASERNIRLFLLGSAVGLLCHQRGLLPLHANAVVTGSGACAFGGPSGSGKSTLAAYFQRAGYELLCDDVCMVAFDDQDRALVWPGLPWLKLWSDAAAQFGYDPSALDRVADGFDKYHVPLARTYQARPLPLRRLYVLGRCDDGDQGRIDRLAGQNAMEAVMAHTYRTHYLGPMGLRARHFRQCAALLRTVPVYSVARAWGFNVFAREAAMLERHMSGDAVE